MSDEEVVPQENPLETLQQKYQALSNAAVNMYRHLLQAADNPIGPDLEETQKVRDPLLAIDDPNLQQEILKVDNEFRMRDPIQRSIARSLGIRKPYRDPPPSK